MTQPRQALAAALERIQQAAKEDLVRSSDVSRSDRERGWTTPDDDGFFDTGATFIGAIGTDDWTLDWTRYDHRPLLIFEDGFE